jgi:CheY-like chemotaxis protein
VPVEATTRTELPPHVLQGLRVLVVEDEDDARTLISTVLSLHGADVRTAASVAEALATIEQKMPDLLVSDIGMPDEDGYALIRKVRARSPEQGGWMPAVALTAYISPGDRARILASGYQLHIPKPVEPNELTAAVASLAGRTGHGVA